MAIYEDVVPLPIFGPSLTINGHSASWNGSTSNRENESGIIIRLPFESPAGESAFNSVDITNDGTAAVYYCWQVRTLFCLLLLAVTSSNKRCERLFKMSTKGKTQHCSDMRSGLSYLMRYLEEGSVYCTFHNLRCHISQCIPNSFNNFGYGIRENLK